MRKTIAMLIAAAIAGTMIASNVLAFPAGGGGFAGGVGGSFGGVTGGAPGMSPNNLLVPNLPGPQQRFRQINLAGRIPTDPAKAAPGAKIVRLSVNGEIVPMALDSETTTAELEFDPNSDYGRQLYQAILTRPITVIGDERLCSEISEAASDPAKTRVLKIDGYVFDRLSPYMVVNSVKDAD